MTDLSDEQKEWMDAPMGPLRGEQKPPEWALVAATDVMIFTELMAADDAPFTNHNLANIIYAAYQEHEAEEQRQTIDGLLDAMGEEKAGTCVWTEIDGFWIPVCQGPQCAEDELPIDGLKDKCPYCGKRIVEATQEGETK